MVMTAQMVRDLFAHTAKPGAVLVTIEAAGLAEAIRLTDWSVPLFDGTHTWEPAAFNMLWGGAGDGEPSRRSKLEVAATGEVVEMIRLATDRPTCVVERVRVAAPGYAERALRGAVITSAEVANGSVQIEIGGRDFASEYAVKARYTQSRTPGLF